MIKAKVLAIDSDEKSLFSLKEILSSKFTIIVAHDSKTAFNLLNQEKYSIKVIIFDLSLTKIDSFDFLKNKKEQKDLAYIPVLVSISENNDEDKIKALELGVLDFITKPYNSKFIIPVLENIILLNENIKLKGITDKDPVTGLKNRAAFYNSSRQILNERTDTSFQMLTIDIDKFNIYNELFRESEGNRLLEYIGLFLSSNLDFNECIVGRIYADTFGILCPTIIGFPEELIDKLNNRLKEFRDDFSIIAHMGVYPITNRSLEISVMITRSLAALDLNKGKVSNCISFYNDQIRSVVHEELAIIREMQSALDRKEFVPYYQPKNDLKTHQIVGAEALVRWIHPKKGIIPPNVFVPIFEKNGFISKLDEYIWEKVCAQIKEWQTKGLEVPPISINLSRIDLYNPNLVNIFQKLVAKYDIPENSIELEITETSYTKNPSQLISVVKNLRMAGFKVEMDDFGTGYSSLNMLSKVPVDVLKLDLGFLKNIETNSKNIDIVYFIMDMAKWMKLDVVAEGVETIEQVNLLISLGCKVGQGYFFSKPLTKKSFEELLVKNNRKSIPQKVDSQIKLYDFWEIHNDYTHTLNSFPMSYALYDYYRKDIRFICSNNAYLNIYSYAFNDTPLNYDALKNTMPKHVNLINRIFEEKTSTLEPICFDFKYQKTNCNSIWLRMIINFVREKRGHYLFSISLMDITSIKSEGANMSDALMSLSRGLLESNIGFWEYDIATREPKFLKDYIKTDDLQVYGKMYDFLKNYIFPSPIFRRLNEMAIKEKNFISDCIQLKLNHRDYWARINCHPCIDNDGQVRKVFGIVTNASFERKAITDFENEVSFKENTSKDAFGYVVFDFEENRIISIDDKNANFTMHQSFKSFKEFIKSIYIDNAYETDKKLFDDYLSKRELLKNYKLGKKEYQLEYRTKNFYEEDYRWIRLSISIIQNPETERFLFIGTITDISEEKEEELSIKLKAYQDPLTQTLNREAFKRNVISAIKRLKTNGEKGAFLIFDIDNFKDVNDNFGHVIGDKAIVTFANTLKTNFRENDNLTRLGGDEFVAFIENYVSKETITQKYEHIKDELINNAIINKLPREIFCSLGVAFYPEDGTTVDKLYKNADMALYDAKRCGKNKVSFFSSKRIKTK